MGMTQEINRQVALLQKNLPAHQKVQKLQRKSAANFQECSDQVKDQNQLMSSNLQVCCV